MTTNGTKISVNKKLNQRLNVVAAQLGISKVLLLDKLGNVPVKELRAFFRKFDSLPDDASDNTQGGT